MQLVAWIAAAVLVLYAPHGAAATNISPSCRSGTFNIASPSDNLAVVTCNGNCDRCTLRCPPNVNCRFTCRDCDRTVFDCGSALSCSLTCRDEESCRRTTLQGASARAVAIVCDDKNACPSTMTASCPSAVGATCGLQCKDEESCKHKLVLGAAVTTVTCEDKEACTSLRTALPSPSTAATGSLSMTCSAKDSCKEMGTFNCPHSGACTVACSGETACEKAGSFVSRNGAFALSCTRTSACKGVEVDGASGSTGSSTISCTAKDSCKEIDVVCSGGHCALSCMAESACEKHKFVAKGPAALTCSGKDACDDATAVCAVGACALRCIGDSACKSAHFTPGSETVVSCEGSRKPCEDLRVEQADAYPTGAVQLKCHSNEACKDLNMNCPTHGTCDVACTSSGACKELDVDCDLPTQDCSVTCSASNSCSGLDYDCDPESGRTKPCTLHCDVSGACPANTVIIDGDLTGTTCTPPASMSFSSGCPYTGSLHRKIVAYWPLNALYCSTFSCPTGFQDKAGQAAIDCGSSCSTGECCDAVLLCQTHACSGGVQDKANKANLLCTGMPPSCDDATCCDAVKKCGTYTCGNGVQDKANKATLTCAGMPPVCNDATCCDVEKKCNVHTCDNGVQDKPAKATIPCPGMPPACDDSTCCDVVKKCDIHKCEKGVQDKPDKATITCTGMPPVCTDATCCDAEVWCGTHVCDNGVQDRANKADIICTGMPPVCNDGTCCDVVKKCGIHKCEKGVQDKPDKATITCTGMPPVCTDATCCDAEVWCGTHACNNGVQDKANKADIICTGMPPVCTDDTCCDDVVLKCGGFTCPKGYTDKAKKADLVCTGSPAACNAATCCDVVVVPPLRVKLMTCNHEAGASVACHPMTLFWNDGTSHTAAPVCQPHRGQLVLPFDVAGHGADLVGVQLTSTHPDGWCISSLQVSFGGQAWQRWGMPAEGGKTGTWVDWNGEEAEAEAYFGIAAKPAGVATLSALSAGPPKGSYEVKVRAQTGNTGPHQGSEGAFAVVLKYKDGSTHAAGKFTGPMVGQQVELVAAGCPLPATEVAQVVVTAETDDTWLLEGLEVEEGGQYVVWGLPKFNNHVGRWIALGVSGMESTLEFARKPSPPLPLALPASSAAGSHVIALRFTTGGGMFLGESSHSFPVGIHSKDGVFFAAGSVAAPAEGESAVLTVGNAPFTAAELGAVYVSDGGAEGWYIGKFEVQLAAGWVSWTTNGRDSAWVDGDDARTARTLCWTPRLETAMSDA